MNPICTLSRDPGAGRRHKFRDDKIEDVRLTHLLDFVFELEILEDLVDVSREPAYVADEMLRDVVGSPLSLSKLSGE